MALPTTYRAFIDGLNALSITGVVRDYTEPPTGAPTTADCPCKFLIYPGGTERSLVFGSQGGLRDLRVEMWIVIEPIAQDTGPTNWDAGVDMMDTVSAVFQDATCITKAHLEWDIDLVERAIAGIQFWVVVVKMRGAR